MPADRSQVVERAEFLLDYVKEGGGSPAFIHLADAHDVYAAIQAIPELARQLEQVEAERDENLDAYTQQRKRAENAEAERDRYRKALRAEWFAKLPDLDYEVDDPERPNQTRWAWQLHPWFDLLGLTADECFSALHPQEGALPEQSEEEAHG
jgi:hypothetical protein